MGNRKRIGWETPSGALMSDNDYSFLSDYGKSKCKPYYGPDFDLSKFLNPMFSSGQSVQEPRCNKDDSSNSADIQAIAIEKYCSPYGKANPQTYAYINGYKDGKQSQLKKEGEDLIEERCIEFAEWMAKQSKIAFMCADGQYKWFEIASGVSKPLTTPELFTLFLQSKNKQV